MENPFHLSLLEAVQDGVYFVTSDRRITFWSRSAAAITGFPAPDVLGSRCSDNILRHIDSAGNELCIGACPLAATLEDGQDREADVYLHHREGHRVPVSIRITPTFDDTGRIIGAVETFTDRTGTHCCLPSAVDSENDIYRDPELPVGNRRLCLIRLDTLTRDLSRHGIPFGILSIRLNRMHELNERFGPVVHSRILLMAARTLTICLRPLDTVCRWGVDEFVAIMPNCNEARLEESAARIRFFLRESWITFDDNTLRIDACTAAAASLAGESVPELLDRAFRKLGSEGKPRTETSLPSADAKPSQPENK